MNHLRIVGDSIEIGQVIRNLVSNALKFTSQKGQVVIQGNVLLLLLFVVVVFFLSHLFRSVRYEPNYLPISRDRKSWSTVLPPQRAQVFSEITPSTIGNILITVTDSGPGLSEEQQHKLFREGVQFNPNELQAGQGSGLGLWISREIVSLHNGMIHVHSKGIGFGSSFEVTFPVILLNEDQPQHLQSSESELHDHHLPPPHEGQQSIQTVPTLTPTNSKEKYVLIVDDASSNRKLVSRMLKSRGYICHEAENG